MVPPPYSPWTPGAPNGVRPPGRVRGHGQLQHPASASPEHSELAALLSGHQVGESVRFSQPVSLCGESFTHAVVERELRSASGAQLIRLFPRGALFISKFEDLRREQAAMCALRAMNQRWRQWGVCLTHGMPVEAVTYSIIPLGSRAGLVEVVPESRTLQQLAQGYSLVTRHERVHQALGGDRRRLDRLAASTAAHLASAYALGIRDGHDDNIMLHSDGAFFRVDLGFVFGQSPELDTPTLAVPRAVTFALGDERWSEVLAASGRALAALCADDRGSEPVAWDCLRRVRELGPFQDEVFAHVSQLSLETFRKQVQRADEWSLSRAAKNTLREAKRYIFDETQVTPEDDWLGLLDGTGFTPTPLAYAGGAGMPSRASAAPPCRPPPWPRPTSAGAPVYAPPHSLNTRSTCPGRAEDEDEGWLSWFY